MGEETKEATVELSASYKFLDFCGLHRHRRKKTILSNPAKAILEQFYII